jgi:hypothetical protein
MPPEETRQWGSRILVRHREPDWRRGRPTPARCSVCGDPGAHLYQTGLVQCLACGAIRVQPRRAGAAPASR